VALATARDALAEEGSGAGISSLQKTVLTRTYIILLLSVEFFSPTLRKCATKTQAGVFLASKSGPGSSPSHSASSEIIQINGDSAPFLLPEHFRHNPSPDHWESSPVFHHAVVSAHGSAAGAGRGKPSRPPQLAPHAALLPSLLLLLPATAKHSTCAGFGGSEPCTSR